jgi:hypothetical protein
MFLLSKFGHVIADCRQRKYYNSLKESHTSTFNNKNNFSPVNYKSNNFCSRSKSRNFSPHNMSSNSPQEVDSSITFSTNQNSSRTYNPRYANQT